MREQRSLFGFTVTRPVAITMVALATMVFGLTGLARLPVNLLPDISYPTVTVRTEYPGAGPQDVEERVSQRIQESVSVVPGVRRVYSVSRPEVSDVILQLAWGTRMVFAVSDIRERLDRVFLPAGAERPLVLRYDPSLDPVLTLGLSGDQSLVELRRIAEEEIERELGEVDGVAAVKIRGGDEEEIRISIDEMALTGFGLDITTVGQRLKAENLNAASGAIEEGRTEYLVRANNEFRNLQQIENLILERRDNVSIRLADVAKVRRVPADKQVISRVDGHSCVLVDVYREAGANIVDLCQRVRARVFGTAAQRAFVAAGRQHQQPVVADAAADAPGAAGDAERRRRQEAFREAALLREMTDYMQYQLQPYHVGIELLQDQSGFIQTAVDDVLDSAVKGGLFAILVIYLFLRRFTATAILAVSIPLSIVATFAPMFLVGIDLNIMSLGGLALGVGMLVDNSIVVLESIARQRDEGMTQSEAGVLGVSNVAGAVIASTLTTVAVFFPIVFVEGVAGQLFRDQALTVVFSLLMSLVVALTVIPMLATRGAQGATRGTLPSSSSAPASSGDPALGTPPRAALPRSRSSRALLWISARCLRLAIGTGLAIGSLLRLVMWPFASVFDRGYRALEASYPRVVRAALRHRLVVVLVAVGLLVAAVLRIPQLGNEMLPDVHQGELFVDAFLPRDAAVERTDLVMAPIEQAIRKLPDVRQTFLASGVDKQELNDSDQGPHSCRILVRMMPSGEPALQEERVRTAVRGLLEAEPEVQSFRFAKPSVLTFNAPLVVEVLGRDLFTLRRACQDVAAALARIPGLRDVRSTLQRGNPEVSIKLDRDKMSALGLDSGVVAAILQTKVQGDVPTRFTERERKIDMRVRMDKEDLDSVGRLLAVNVNPKGNPIIPLASIAAVRKTEGPSEIRRIGNVRGAEVQAALAGFDLGSTQRRVEEALAGLHLPRGVEVRLGGQKEELAQSLHSLIVALLLAVFLVYIVMASQFESIVQPLVILVSMPLALVGVVFTLDLLHIPLSVIVFLGGIVLAGIVVNNAIILIDQINRLRAEGMAKLEAIARGAQIRLRPVLMTTLTTVLGLLPLTGWLAGVPLLGGATEGIELRAPMAVTVISGLTVSTLLTLLVVPVVYSLSDRRP